MNQAAAQTFLPGDKDSGCNREKQQDKNPQEKLLPESRLSSCHSLVPIFWTENLSRHLHLEVQRTHSKWLFFSNISQHSSKTMQEENDLEAADALATTLQAVLSGHTSPSFNCSPRHQHDGWHLPRLPASRRKQGLRIHTSQERSSPGQKGRVRHKLSGCPGVLSATAHSGDQPSPTLAPTPGVTLGWSPKETSHAGILSARSASKLKHQA